MTLMSQPPPAGFEAPHQPGPPPPWVNTPGQNQHIQGPAPQKAPTTIQVVTTPSFPGRTIGAALGEVIGVAVRDREIDRRHDPAIAYPAMLLHSRQQAVARMADMARERGADAVVGLQFDSSEITQDLSEVVAYGTAVRFAD